MVYWAGVKTPHTQSRGWAGMPRRFLGILIPGYIHALVPLLLFGLAALWAADRSVPAALGLLAPGIVGAGFLLAFFRDPPRERPEAEAGERCILSGADGWVRSVERYVDEGALNGPVVRISTFLSPFDVHVNRAPVSGTIAALSYTPGRHFLTLRESASEENEHSTIRFDCGGRPCVVRQIVGPVVRRVVYWLQENQPIQAGDRIGMMKFGSRLDILLPDDAVEVRVGKGDRVHAGNTVVAHWKEEI